MSTHHDEVTEQCSVTSFTAGEQVFGSMKPHPIWFLLEYEGRWESDAFENSDLPAPVKTRLVEQMDSVRAHLLVIRQKPRVVDYAGITFFVALTREHDPALYEFHLSSYEDLLTLDLAALCAGDAAFDAHRRTAPLFLVCTHGRHDRCCARHGVPVIEQLAAHVPNAAWQSSHMGGHRFAANMLCFPHGVNYGRVTAENVLSLTSAYSAGQLVPAHYRGRAAYTKPIQAADYFLRMETGIDGLEAFTLLDAARTPEGWRVRFADQQKNTAHTLTLVEDPEGVRVLASCGDVELSSYPQYTLAGYETAPLA